VQKRAQMCFSIPKIGGGSTVIYPAKSVVNTRLLRVIISQTNPRAVVEMGLKSDRPDSTKWARTSAQSFRSSHEILAGGSTSTGITWLTAPHWISTTAVPIPPARRQRSSRRWMSAATSGSREVTYVRGTMCVPLMANLRW